MKTYLIKENCPPNEAELEIKTFLKHVGDDISSNRPVVGIYLHFSKHFSARL